MNDTEERESERDVCVCLCEEREILCFERVCVCVGEERVILCFERETEN
jgi:hypothetical protein